MRVASRVVPARGQTWRTQALRGVPRSGDTGGATNRSDSAQLPDAGGGESRGAGIWRLEKNVQESSEKILLKVNEAVSELAPDSVGVVKKVNSTLESVWGDFYYCNRGESDHSVDVLKPTSGTGMFATDKGDICVVAHTGENGSRVITSSIIFSALFDEEPNTKKTLMQRYLGFMLWEKKLQELFANHISINGIHIGRSVSSCVSWMKIVLSRLSRLNCYVLQKKQTLDIEKR